MEKFEKQFEDLDVQSGVMENSMSNSVTTSVPQVCHHYTVLFHTVDPQLNSWLYVGNVLSFYKLGQC